MMKWTDKKTVLSLATAIVIFIGGFFIALDKGFDFWEEHIAPAKAMNNKVKIERPESSVPEYVEYKDRTLHGYTAEQSK